MKRIVLVILSFIFLASIAFSADINLGLMWDANTETDMDHYNLYRTDGTRVLLGFVNHPTTQYNFTISVPDKSEGVLSFVATAVDKSGNESGDSNTVTYPFDQLAPAVPGGLKVNKR